MQQVEVPKLLSVNYYNAAITVASGAATRNLQFFLAQSSAHGGSSSDYNDLGDSAILPDNREGELTGVMVRMRDAISGTSGQGIDAIQDLHIIRGWRLTVLLNQNIVTRGPVFAFPHPPMWVGGAENASASAVSSVIAENAGYQLYQINHHIAPRQTIEVRLQSRGSETLQQNRQLEISLQFADKRLV